MHPSIFVAKRSVTSPRQRTSVKSVEFPELSPSGLLLVRVFFYEIISSGDDASFMEVCCAACV